MAQFECTSCRYRAMSSSAKSPLHLKYDRFHVDPSGRRGAIGVNKSAVVRIRRHDLPRIDGMPWARTQTIQTAPRYSINSIIVAGNDSTESAFLGRTRQNANSPRCLREGACAARWYVTIKMLGDDISKVIAPRFRTFATHNSRCSETRKSTTTCVQPRAYTAVV